MKVLFSIILLLLLNQDYYIVHSDYVISNSDTTVVFINQDHEYYNDIKDLWHVYDSNVVVHIISSKQFSQIKYNKLKPKNYGNIKNNWQ